MTESRIESIKRRVRAVEMLRILAEEFGSGRIAELLGLPAPAVSRYVNGHVLPKEDRVDQITRLFEARMREAIVSNMRRRGGVLDVTPLLSNVRLLRSIAMCIAQELPSEIERVLTKEVDGIPLAALVSDELGASLVVAKRRKEPGVERFYEVRQTYESGIYSYIYVPKHLLGRGDRVLIVDDIVRSGSTVRALIEVVKKARGRVVGVYSVASLGGTMEQLAEAFRFPVRSFVRFV